MTRSFAAAVLFAVLIVGTGAAQDAPTLTPAPPPVLSQTDRERIELAELRLENTALRIDLLMKKAKTLEAEAAALLASLARDGFHLTRTQAGAWVYVPAEPVGRPEK